MAKTETYETILRLNTEQAKKEIDKIQKKVDELEKKRQQALDAGDTKGWQKLGKEIEKEKAKLQQVENHFNRIDRTLRNMSNAGPKELKDTIKSINAMLNDGSIKRGSAQWNIMTAALKEANTELGKIKQETKAGVPALQRFFKILNDSWGGVIIMFESITRLSMSVRSTVEEYAKMEEAMADTRKYTGLTDTAIRELNENLKKMDTRTSREELNELAGVAGRLGITSKAAILDFVDAANQIKVALGDDLGEDAIDKVGKLAMAFGEDEKMGLRGAMLATGSAVNELAQNSSAQAGYLVDFTARVAGFGKQLGLTQAQIMGFGAVMDENLLRDEMAATAFGNMLTKMQTDTAKFARIAGMEVKEFTDLLNKDANQAILTLADSLKKADPQSMMKMLDDMGLDGSRAVGVLSTMADKIDDVRARQELATKAYKEGTSVGKEYDTMNNTVEAGIEKCKKRFQEMAVELGEKLVPVVRYTISTTSILIKALSTVLNFTFQNIESITKIAVVLAEYVAIKKLHYLWTQRNIALEKIALALDNAQRAVTKALIGLRKAHTIAILAHNGAITKTIALQRIWNEIIKKNPIALVVTAVALLTAGIWKLVEAMNASGQKQRLVNELYGKAAEKVAEEKAEISQLLRVAKDEKEQLDKRKEAIEKLNSIIPGYNGQLDETTGKYTENAIALKNYNTLLKEKYRLEAAEDKLKELEKKRFKEDLDYEEKMRESQEREASGGTALTRWVATQGPQAEGGVSEKAYQEQITRDHEKQNAELQKQIDIVSGIRDATKEVVDFNRQLNTQMEEQRKKLEGDGIQKESPASTPTNYVSDTERKKQEQERHRQEIEERKHLKEAEDAAKAEADAAIAAKTHEYATGKIAYRQYIQDMAALQKEGLEKRRDVYQKGTAEYEKLNRQIEELDFKGDQKVNQMKLEDLQRCMIRQQMEIEAQAAREEITEAEKQERLRTLNETFLAEKLKLYREGSLERMNAEWDLEQAEQRNKTERERYYQQQLEQIRQEYLGMSNERLLQTALAGLDELHKKGLIKEDEYQRALIAVRAQYGSTQTPSEQTQRTASDMLTNARNAAAPTESSTPIVGTIQNYQTLMEKLKELYGQDQQNHEAYLTAKQQATSEFCGQLASEMQAAYNTVNQIMSAASSLYSAQADYETAVVKKKYEKQIAAAGNNQKKVKKLQEKQAKEEAAIKTKYNRKQVKIQIAQAIAQTAMNALNAYGSVVSIPVVGPALAVVAAAAAVAAGMIQIAAIKKQADAQEAGYYEGGYTGGKRYSKEAGVVHEGEFVANHLAVNNPNVRPMLDFIDKAQRNNTVGSLTAGDISRQLGQGGTAVVAPVVNVNNDNEDLRDSLDRSSEVSEELLTVIREKGIHLDFPMDSFDKAYKHFIKLNNR